MRHRIISGSQDTVASVDAAVPRWAHGRSWNERACHTFFDLETSTAAFLLRFNETSGDVRAGEKTLGKRTRVGCHGGSRERDLRGAGAERRNRPGLAFSFVDA